MSYLKYDKILLANLEKSLDKEMLRTNRAGAYASTTVVDCNTRKYHGLLVVPVPEIDDENHVLLSSCDETIIQHGAEFNLGLHKYQGDYFSPKGHKYIREFHFDSVATSVYRVGGVVLQKQRILVEGENRILVSYTLLEAHSATTIRLKPFLAFRNVNELTYKNDNANTQYTEVENGVSFNMYANYPNLVLQVNKKNSWNSHPDWYLNIEYHKEAERGYEYKEDLFVPGYIELPIKKGETIVFSAGVEPVNTRKLKQLFQSEISKRVVREDFVSSLTNAAQQFYSKCNDGYYLLAGYPWFKYRARDQFIALPGTTLVTGNVEMFERIISNSIVAIRELMKCEKNSTKLTDIDVPDVILWFVWTIQQYTKEVGLERGADQFTELVVDIINYIRKQHHPNLFIHSNGLLFANGLERPASWMNAVEDGRPITPRTGYLVEINALWYNALKFAAELLTVKYDNNQSDLFNYQAETSRKSFVEKFWNGTYLYDYVVDDYNDLEVRPNMIFAVSLPYSPLDRAQQKSVVDIITRELLTVKGLRSLSPKSGMYCPIYIGGQLERDRNYHNGPIWSWITASFIEAYLKVYKLSGVSFVMRILAGIESEVNELTIGTLSELYDGNPPFRGHGAMSYAMSVGEVLRAQSILKEYVNVINEENKLIH